ncbi:MAG: T9SS type A sorting domain-containing protein [Fluviicola sp.]|nr:T9SS type A sorting domain-containing protein [Fluviicola sp.]
MKQLLLMGSLAFSVSAFAQTTLFQDDFEAGGGNWTLNGGSGGNNWIVNNVYTGFSPFIPDTPAQPGGITNSPSSTYMHVTNSSICGAGICNSNYDTGSASNQPTTLTSSINAAGYGNITLSFWYLCAGTPNLDFGTVEYSTDGGGTWTATGTSYQNVSTWTQTSVSLPAWDNATALKFRFRWQNSAASGLDPAFSIDEVEVTGMGGSFATITTDNINAPGWCFNTAANVAVGFDVTGTVNAGNIYTAQLSNAAGSFTSPTSIGSLTSSATGALSINGVIPGGTPAGSGYRIRVVASDPVTTGSDNGSNLTIFAQPTITIIGNPADGVICNGETITMLGSGGVSYVWTPNATIDFPTQAQVIATPTITTQYTAVGTDVNGCTNTATFNVTVENCSSINENEVNLFSLYPNPATDLVNVQAVNETAIQGIELLDQNGRFIRSAHGNTSMSVADLATGSYFIRVIHESGTSTLRFTKK